jgi:hypothetical protein
VTHVLCEYEDGIEWCPITGVNENCTPCAATACIVEDSGEGACYLVVGGEWGLRLRPPNVSDVWDLANLTQWGTPYLLLGGQGADLRFTQ